MAWDNLISRTAWLLVQPSHLFLLLLLLGIFLLWRGSRNKGLALLSGGALFYGLVMLGPLAALLTVPLEQRFSAYTNKIDAGPYGGIIVLAGAERRTVSRHHDQVSLSGAGERLIEGARLARLFPDLPVIFSGGRGGDGRLSEAEIARRFFAGAGIDPARLRFDERAYNTHGNAREVRRLITGEDDTPWLLVTSAFHMPRAVGAFRAAGVPHQPYPVDYRTTLSVSLFSPPDAGANMAQLDEAAHEWLGLLTYYLRGHSATLFPAP